MFVYFLLEYLFVLFEHYLPPCQVPDSMTGLFNLDSENEFWHNLCEKDVGVLFMVYTLSSQYAIRALIYLANQSNHQYRRIEEVAEAEEIPQAFLAKLVQRMVKKGLLRSLKGLRGGIELARPAEEITLFMIANAIDDLSHISMECALGYKECSDKNPCSLHERWKVLRNQQIHFMESITLAELVKPKTRQRR